MNLPPNLSVGHTTILTLLLCTLREKNSTIFVGFDITNDAIPIVYDSKPIP